MEMPEIYKRAFDCMLNNKPINPTVQLKEEMKKDDNYPKGVKFHITNIGIDKIDVCSTYHYIFKNYPMSDWIF